MLKQILSLLPQMNAMDLREVNKAVCNLLKLTHTRRLERTAAKFETGEKVLHCGKKYEIENVLRSHLLVDNGRMVPMAQCRPIK